MAFSYDQNFKSGKKRLTGGGVKVVSLEREKKRCHPMFEGKDAPIFILERLKGTL